MTIQDQDVPGPPDQREIADALARAMDDLRGREGLTGTVVGIAGESGSGKTTIAAALAAALEHRGLVTATLHQDDYFVRPPRVNHEFRRSHPESVGPGEVNLALLAEHLGAFRTRRRDVPVPVVDYPGDRFDVHLRDFSGVDVLILEGTYVLLLDGLHVGVFLSATHEQTRARRVARARDVFEPFVDDVLRTEHRIIAPLREHAHLVVSEGGTVRRRR